MYRHTINPRPSASSRRNRRAMRAKSFRTGFEPLEERHLLSASNLLVSTFDDTAGSSVLVYNETTRLRAPGGNLTSENGLGMAQGVAVATDGSYYVSSLASGRVLHYENSGKYLGFLGDGDVLQAPLVAPATSAI
jgi:hypothetical protein